MTTFLLIATICNGLSTIFAFSLLFIKPIREWLLGSRAIKEGQKCTLRSDMLSTYYRHCDDESIRQYEKENFILEYKAYKALGGNSFIDDIYERVRKWEVHT